MDIKYLQPNNLKKLLPNGKILTVGKKILYTSFAAGIIIILFALVLLFFPQTYINGFLKSRINDAFAKKYPEYSLKVSNVNFNFFKNRIECDSISLVKIDSTLLCKINTFSIDGIGWIGLFHESNSFPASLAKATVNIEGIVIDFKQSESQLRCSRLHLSVPDSEIVSDSIKYYPLIDDEQFFAKNRFRQTRFRLDIPQLEIIGLDYPGLLQGNIYNTGSIKIHDMFADILVNMDKPYDKNSSNPQMPNEALSSIKEKIKVDSLKVLNGQLKYCERSMIGAKPGMISFKKINVSISGITNHTVYPDTAIIIGSGLFMNSGIMKMFMAIPLSSKDFSLRYSGSLSRMDVANLNVFIEPSEHQRIKSGVLQSAAFNINVNAGRANGKLNLVYKNLSIAVLNKNTGSENGIFNRILSVIGKVFVIRGSNISDSNGQIKIGEIKYVRNPGDYFLQFIWFALRNGVADVVGFPPIQTAGK